MKNKIISWSLVAITLLIFSCTPKQKEKQPDAAVNTGEMDRTVLPIKEPARKSYTELNVRNATPPPRFEVKAPKGAPNVVVVLIDDMGFGASNHFGGPCTMPTLDKM